MTTRKISKAEATFALHCRAVGIEVMPEYLFTDTRRWRADFAIPELSILIEIDGGNRMAVIGKDGKPYAVGRHTQDDDYEKMNHAALLGYKVFRFTPKQVQSGYAIMIIEKAVKL